ncbi:metal ABC transporter permease [Demequina sp. SYSU T00039]|uniref:Metal ABC transporter permease n=1 Tax=Demequina lignilytica TaxID=3051663 RepID=A0AAW7LZU8_9MICO|nr:MULTISPECIES: metal ABC transporter permease [unclassified Demequina]MDN4478484.1 metal ABC transporter permease [Demequina sp. SYSU T00039-1]MDN4487009.1 metal ABC transporter permease [Demequina sp. SYSU T00039]MDN4489720.1 metal ABC transporter permease [Demequina sp. SYSU T00068]
MNLLAEPLIQRMLIVGLLVGMAAPVMGTYLVQRRMALLGDGIGHVALAGVAAGWLAGAAFDLARQDALAIPGAVVFAIIGAVVIERMRSRGTAADIVMAILFYGGIASGVLLIGLAGGSNANLLGYLFGSISTVTWGDVWMSAGLAALILVVGLGLRAALFTVTHDQEFARSTGLPVDALNMVVAVLAAVTITVAMRVVGVLLVSALMIVPVAIAQLLTRSFARTMHVAMGLGAALTLTGIWITVFQDIQPGSLIVVIGVVVYVVVALITSLLKGSRR